MRGGNIFRKLKEESFIDTFYWLRVIIDIGIIIIELREIFDDG